MPTAQRTLGKVGMPSDPFDIVPKTYVDNIDPDVLTYFRLSDLQISGAGTGNLYSTFGDFSLGNLRSGNTTNNSYSRAPFPMRIIKYGLMYQPNTIAAYNNFLSQTYLLSLSRYNPAGTTPPAVVLSSASLLSPNKYLNANLTALPIPIGTSNTDVYQWTGGCQGTATNIGSINYNQWFEFRPVSQSEIDNGDFQNEKDEFEEKAELRTLEMLDENPDLFKNFNSESADDKINDTNNRRDRKKTN